MGENVAQFISDRQTFLWVFQWEVFKIRHKFNVRYPKWGTAGNTHNTFFNTILL